MRAIAGVLDDLPVIAHHEIARDEKRLAVEDAHAPVEVGIHEVLHEHDLRVLEHRLRDGLELPEVGRLLDLAAERPIGHLQNDRIVQVVLEARQRAPADQACPGRADAVLAQQLGEKRLVRASQDRARIIDHRHALRLRLLGELEGVVSHRRGLSNEQRVELCQPREVLLANQLHRDVHVFADLDDARQRRKVRRRQRIIRIMQDRQIHLRNAVDVRRTPAATRELVQGSEEQGISRHVHVPRIQRLDRCRLPTGQPRGTFEFDLEQGAAKQLEALARQVGQRRILNAPEEDVEAERVDRSGDLVESVDQSVELRQKALLRAALLQIEDCLHARRDAVAARLGQQ